MVCNKCGANMPEKQEVCTACGTRVGELEYAVEPTSKLPMRWFKVLIYFLLFAVAIVNIADGIWVLIGGHYDGPASEIYDKLPGLHRIDIIYGLASLVIAAMAIFTRFSIAHFRSAGPASIVLLHALNLGLSMFYVIAIAMITDGVVIDDFAMLLIPFDLAMIAVNSVYFKKREKLFVN